MSRQMDVVVVRRSPRGDRPAGMVPQAKEEDNDGDEQRPTRTRIVGCFHCGCRWRWGALTQQPTLNGRVVGRWHGASLGGAKSNVFNPTLRLFSHTCLISLILVYIRRVTTTRQDGTKSTNNRQTPSPWWWSRSPLQWRGFDEPTPPEGWAALRMLVPMPPSKRFNRSNKLM